MAELQSAHVIITAKQFNPSIVDRHWLVQNQILTEAEFLENCVFTPVVSHVNSQPFNLIALPDRLQFTPNSEADGQAVVTERLGRIIQTLPHTPYSATGMNFLWRARIGGDIPAATRGLFFHPDGPFGEEFDVPDARFGAYFSKDILGGRLKLDVKPAITITAGAPSEAINLVFNFHFDLPPDDTAGALVNILQRWAEAKTIAERLTADVED